MNKSDFPYILLFVGESGCGKTTVAERLKELRGWKQIASYTTRPWRYPGETGHIFVDCDRMGSLLQFAVAATYYNGEYYCATAGQVDDHEIYVVDPVGVDTLMSLYKGEKTPLVIFFDCSEGLRKERMLARGDEMDDVVKRIKNDKKSFRKFRRSLKKRTRTLVIDANADVDTVCNEIIDYVDSTRKLDDAITRFAEEVRQYGEQRGKRITVENNI